MTKQNVAEPESLGEAMNRTELFFEKERAQSSPTFFWGCWFSPRWFTATGR